MENWTSDFNCCKHFEIVATIVAELNQVSNLSQELCKTWLPVINHYSGNLENLPRCTYFCLFNFQLFTNFFKVLVQFFENVGNILTNQVRHSLNSPTVSVSIREDSWRKMNLLIEKSFNILKN